MKVMKKISLLSISDPVIYTLIVINAIVLFIESFDTIPVFIISYLYAIDYFCTVYFVYEMLAKISLGGSGQYFSNIWNQFDFTIVVLSTPMLIEPLITMKGFGILLVLRTARLLRLMRLFNFIPNVKQLWAGVARALRASVGVFFALFIYLFILSLISTQVFGSITPDYFGNPIRAMYSMFQLFTVEGWYEIPNAIAAQSSQATAAWAKLFFSFVVLTAGVMGFSLANAVFVDEMVIDNTNDLEAQVDRIDGKVDDIKEKINNMAQNND